MHNKNDQLDKTREIPEIPSKEEENGVHKDQQSMFDTADAFSESMVVEKEAVEIDSSENAASSDENGDTAVFDFANAHKEVDVKNLEDTAKDYYNATHSSSIEDKINELRNLADEGFEGDATGEIDAVSTVSEVFDGEPDEKARKKALKKAEKKKKKKGRISNDDIEMLMNKDVMKDVAEVFAKTTEDIPVVSAEKEEDKEEDVTLYSDEGVTEDEKLLYALGGKNEEEYKSFEAVFEDDEPEDEYTDRNEESGILKKLRNKAIYSMISVILTVVVTLLCFYFEAAAGTKMAHPEIFEPGRYSVVYGMSMLQLMFIGVMFNLDGVKRAFMGLRPNKPAFEGFCAATLVVCTLHTVVSCIMAGSSSKIVSFCTAGCIALMLLSVNSFIKAQTALTSFCFAASKHPKYSFTNIEKGASEETNFEKYLDADTTLFKVEKSDFVKGFFKKSAMSPACAKGTFARIVVFASIALVAAIICGILFGAYSGVCAFTTVCLASFPVNALISTAFPFFIASSRAKRIQTAYIGEAACDVYEKAGVVSFDDTEVFPPRSVKVSSIRTYGDNRIDKVILYMAKIFGKVQGPLSYVFSNSVQNIDDFGGEAKIDEHFSNGISAKIDDKEVFVGTGEFLRLYDIETPIDNIDDSFTRSMGSIMYMSVNGTLAAKFYIKYAINRNFEALLHSFYDAGICVGVRTYDPNVNDELICGNLKGSNYPISVIKIHHKKDENEVAESTEGSIISISNLHNFLKGFIRLDNLRNVYRSNTFISLLSSIIGLGLGVFFSVTGAGMGVLFMTVFQLLWCVPTILFSVLSK